MTEKTFKNKDLEIHMLIAMRRYKENDSSIKRSYVIRELIKTNLDVDFQILKRKLLFYGGIWRIYRTVNKRSTIKAFKSLIHYMIDHPECAPYLDSEWKSHLLKQTSKAERKYLIDFDCKEPGILKDFIESLKLNNINVLEDVETPNGYHFICNPFDVRIFKDDNYVTILKDGYFFMGLVNQND